MQLKNLGNSINAVNDIQSILSNSTGINSGKSSIQSLQDTAKGYSTEVLKLAASQIVLTEAQAKAIFQAKGLTGEELNQAIATATLASSQTKAARITQNLGTAFQGLKLKIKDTVTSIWAFITASPAGGIIGIASAVVAVTATVVTINKKIEEHRQKLKEAGAAAREEIKSLQNDLDSFSSSTNNALEAYTKLMEGVDTSKHTNLSLSEEEYADFISAGNELADLFPELVVGLDKEGNRIVSLGDSAADATEKINGLIEAQRKLVAEETEEKLVDVFKGTYEDTRDINKELKSYQENLDYFNNTDFRELIAGWNSIKEAKTISISDSYADGLDSEILINSAAKVINDSLGTNLKAQYSEMTYEWFLDLSTLTEEQYENAIQSLYLNSDLLKGKIIESLEASISGARDEINKHHKQELSSIFTALSGDINYISLTDTERQLADALIAGLDYSEYRDEIKSKYKGDITSFLNKEILDTLYNATDEDKKRIDQLYTNLLSIEPEASLSDNIQSIENYIHELAEVLHMDENELKIRLGYEFMDEDKERIRQAKIKATGNDTGALIVDSRTKSSYDPKPVQAAIDALKEEDITLFLAADISDDTKFETAEEFEHFMDSLREQANVSLETDLSSYLSNNKELEALFLQLSKTGKLDESAIQSLEEYDDMLSLCSNDADKLIQELNELANQSSGSLDAANNLTTITGGLDALSEVYSQAMENGFVQSDTITKLYDRFSDLSVIDSFVEAMQNIGNANYDTAQSFHDLANAYINTNLPLTDLTEATKQQYIEELQGNGVTNAKEAIEQRLAYVTGIREQALASLVSTQKYANLTTEDLANATISEINTMIDAANAVGMDTSALNTLAMMKANVTANQITEATSISEILTVAKACGITTPQLATYNYMKSHITGAPASALEQIANQAKQSVLNAITSFDFGFEKYNYGGGGKYASSLGSASAGSASQAKDTVKQYNWIETAMNRVKEALARLTRVRDNAYADWSKRNTALNSEITKITEQLHLQQQAYNHYMAEADSVGLSQDYIRKLQSGAIQVEDISDEGLQNQIDRYQDWYDQALECSDAIEELTIHLSELAQQKFDSLQTEFEALISTFTAQADVMEERISRAEAQGYFADKHYYEELIAYENQELASLRREYTALQTALREAIDTGRIEAGSEAWHKMRAELLDVEQSIEESTTALVEFQNEIRNLSWNIFDYIADRIGQITQESDFLIDLLEHGSLYETTGAFTSQGMAATALHGVNYNTWLQQSLDYAEALRQMEADLANDPQNKDLIERREALLKLQQDAITSAEAEKDAIQSLVKDGMKLHLDALSQLIDKYKEGLSAAKDLQDYQKNISEQTADIAGLEKIMLAYQGDDSEEARKLLQDTQNQLQDARQELEETEWERYISETEDLLDALYDEYETILNQRLDNIDALIADMIDMVNAGSTDIQEVIEATAFKAGYDISSTMQTIFGSGGNQTTLLSTFLNRFDTASTTLQKAVNDIKTSIQTRMTAPAGTDGIGSTDSMSGIGSNSGLNIGNSGASASGSPTPQASAPQGDGTVGIGDLVTFASGRYHEDSWGNGRSGAQNLNGQVYITRIKPDSPYPYHISRGTGLGNGDLGWVKLEQLKGYQYGARRIHGNQWAWTQEDGRELIRTSSGAILTPLGNGDTVFTNEMTQRLWELSNGSIPIPGLDIHTMAHRPELPGSPQVVNNSNAITITLPNVTNYAEFKQELQKDNRFIGFVQEVTSGQALGNPRLNRRKY